MSAEAAEREGGRAAEIGRHVETARSRKIRASTAASNGPEGERLSLADVNRHPVFDGRAVHGRRHVSARQSDYCVGAETKRRTRHGHLERRSTLDVAEDPIAEPLSEIV